MLTVPLTKSYYESYTVKLSYTLQCVWMVGTNLF